MGGEGSPQFRDINPDSQTSQNPADVLVPMLPVQSQFAHELRFPYHCEASYT